jgi:hypothetical protein
MKNDRQTGSYLSMLKVIYNSTSIYLDILNIDLADWVEQRRIFAVSTGESLTIGAGRASILLPDAVCPLDEVSDYLKQERVKNVALCRSDYDNVEIVLTTGYWLSLANSIDADFTEGVFVTELLDRGEVYLWELWYTARMLDREMNESN